ncbi:hypothetical protein BH10BAC1_BH10BAC1_17960 [soil metagenome]
MKATTSESSKVFYKRKLEILYSIILTVKKLEENIGVVERVLSVKKIAAEN